MSEKPADTVIIRYNAGNVRSVTCALERLGVTPVVTDDPETIIGARRVIFPGVGEASSAMGYLKQQGLDRLIQSLTQPFLGICLGMQLMCRWSEESDTTCLGLFEEDVKLFRPRTYGDASTGGSEGAVRKRLKVPHMGWNTLFDLRGPLFQGISAHEDYVYFVHSFYAALGEGTAAASDYGIPFSAGLERYNYFGVQFHPEKSGPVGERILQNFLVL